MIKTILVMDSSGDSRTQFDEANQTQLDDAKALFERLLASGATAFSTHRDGGAQDKIVTNFESLERETLIVPRVVGG